MINFFLHASILQFYSSFYIEKMFTIFHSTSFYFFYDKSNKKKHQFPNFPFLDSFQNTKLNQSLSLKNQKDIWS